jgi:hypothetical protein
MTVEAYLDLRDRVIAAGYESEIDWAESVKPPQDAEAFFSEYAWVVLNSGMKEQVARLIWARVREALSEQRSVRSAFGHPGKAAAIQKVYEQQAEYFRWFLKADDKMAFLRALPWIGPITVYHLAKNYGVDCVKPDRHLVRIADAAGETPEALCRRIATVTGERLAAVDSVIWRAANLGFA